MTTFERCGWLRLCVLTLTLFATSGLDAASPILSKVLPRGGQRGTTMEVHFYGDRLGDAAEVLCYQPGLTFADIKSPSPNEMVAQLTIAPDTVPGTKHLRVRTATGMTEMRTFTVSPLPNVKEVEPNNEFTTPQNVTLNSTVEGVIDNEDVDYFVVEAKQGTRITAEVEGIRLGNTMFDCYVAILSEARFELSSSDDAALVYQDGIASVIAPADGKYIVQIRESSYRGDGNCHYRCHIGSYPRPRAVVPAGGRPGEMLNVTFLGDVAGPMQQTVTLPSLPDTDYQLFASDANGPSPSGNRFRVIDLENCLEQEPNGGREQATRGPAIGAYNGYIEAVGDEDWFAFTAKQGQVFDFSVFARRLRSEMDPVLLITNKDGAGLVSNDDSAGPDCYLRFQAPADGEFFFTVFDQLRRGGPAFHYRVEVTPVAPQLSLSVNEFVQYIEPRLSVARGNRLPMLISANRRDFGGQLEFLAERLPPGVTIESFGMSPNQGVAQMLLVAAPDAPASGMIGQIVGRLQDPNNPLPPSAAIRQDVILVRGQNQVPFWVEPVQGLAISVTEPAPFRLELVEPKAPLVQSGTIRLKVVAHRDPGFTAPIKIELLMNPNGTNSSRETSIAEGQTEAFIDMNAAGNAEVGEHKLSVRGEANTATGPMTVASPFATLKISEPYVRLAFQAAAVEQGQATDLVVGVEVVKPFEGAGNITLYGLPNKVTTEALQISKDSKEVVYKVAAAADAPVTQTKDLFCQVILTEQGEPVVHNIGSGALRIDQPLPPKVDAPPAAPMPTPMPVAAAEAPPKRLSRLEQLRLDQKNKLAAANGGTAPTEAAPAAPGGQ